MVLLILYNVLDDELYVGDDGIKRLYVMVFLQFVFYNYLLFFFVVIDMEENRQDGLLRVRKVVNEIGLFGKLM